MRDSKLQTMLGNGHERSQQLEPERNDESQGPHLRAESSDRQNNPGLEGNEQLSPDVIQTSENDSTTRPSSKSSRFPRTNSRPMLRRSSSHVTIHSEDGNGQSSAEVFNVLITEVQTSESEDRENNEDEEDIDCGAGEDVQEKNVTEGDRIITGETLGLPGEPARSCMTDEDYDTDLDDCDDDDENDAMSHYMSICEQLEQVPVKYFLRHIQDRNIRMRYRGLGSDETKAIALSLRENVTLEQLDISGNWIGADGARSVCRLLEENDYITDVNLSGNKIGSEGGLSAAKMIQVNAGLRGLDLSDNDLDDKCAESLSSSLESNKYLRELNLSHNNLTEVAAQFLGPAIGANENLDVLNLSWNHMRESGGIIIAKGLKENIRLKVCDLSWNGLATQGGLAIADAMMANQSLLELDISGNRLTYEVAIKMAKVLATNDSLRILKMGNNLITSAGAIALVSAINNTESCELQELDLADVSVEYEFIRTMEDIMRKKPNFKIKHGPVMRAGNARDDLSKPAIDQDIINKEPVIILKEHIVVNDLHLIDILKKYDKDKSMRVSVKNFLTAMEELGVPYDRMRLKGSLQNFSGIEKGKIYFGGFISDDGIQE